MRCEAETQSGKNSTFWLATCLVLNCYHNSVSVLIFRSHCGRECLTCSVARTALVSDLARSFPVQTIAAMTAALGLNSLQAYASSTKYQK
ncbi:hypothetical protein V1527DRAFT_457762 [Lipomyces starkeyi]